MTPRTRLCYKIRIPRSHERRYPHRIDRVITSPPNRDMLSQEVAAWEAARNGLGTSVNWQFTAETGRIKLTHLYPAPPR
jgi:hypothetical protein